MEVDLNHNKIATTRQG